MMKLICLSFSLSLSLYTFAKSKQVTSIYNLRSHVQSISKKNLVNSLRMFVYKGKPNRFFASSGHKKVQQFLYSTLKNYKTNDDTKVTEDIFDLSIDTGKALYQSDFDQKIVPSYKPGSPDYKKWSGFKNYMHSILDKYKSVQGKNYIWEKKGTSDKVLVVTAHYDTVSHDPKTLRIDEKKIMPGADYNASGMSIALALIRLIHDQKLTHTIRIVFLDAQALGFLGAYDYAQKLKVEKENITGVLNLEMLGHDSKHFDKKKKYKNFKIYARSKKSDPDDEDIALINMMKKIDKKTSVNIKFEVARNDFNNSDNFRFWDVGIPAITLSQNWEDDFNPKYQSGNDFPETINQQSLYNAFQYIAQGVLGHLLNI